MNDREMLVKLFEENRTQARFHESQRGKGMGLIAAGAAVILTAITHDQKLSLADLPLAIMLGFVGVFGSLFCQKEYERMRLHLGRAERFLSILDRTDRSFDLVRIKAEVDRQHNRRFFISSRIRLNLMWQLMSLLITCFAALIVFNIVEESHGVLNLLRLLGLR